KSIGPGGKRCEYHPETMILRMRHLPGRGVNHRTLRGSTGSLFPVVLCEKQVSEIRPETSHPLHRKNPEAKAQDGFHRSELASGKYRSCPCTRAVCDPARSPCCESCSLMNSLSA